MCKIEEHASRKDEEEATFGDFLKILAVVFLIAGVLKFGTESYFLNRDLKRSEQQTACWIAIAQKLPPDRCPPGCNCIAWTLR